MLQSCEPTSSEIPPVVASSLPLLSAWVQAWRPPAEATVRLKLHLCLCGLSVLSAGGRTPSGVWFGAINCRLINKQKKRNKQKHMLVLVLDLVKNPLERRSYGKRFHMHMPVATLILPTLFCWFPGLAALTRRQSQTTVLLLPTVWLGNKVHGDAFNDNKISDGSISQSITFHFQPVSQTSYCSEWL